MLVITITNLVSLVYMAGLSGGYVFIPISVNFLTTYVVLWKTIKVIEKEDSEERKKQVPKEDVPRLAIKNEKENKKESENAAIEMSLLTAGASKDFEGQELEQQPEAKPEETEGTDTSKDIESQEEKQQTEAVLENESKDEKSRKDKKAE